MRVGAKNLLGVGDSDVAKVNALNFERIFSRSLDDMIGHQNRQAIKLVGYQNDSQKIKRLSGRQPIEFLAVVLIAY